MCAWPDADSCISLGHLAWHREVHMYHSARIKNRHMGLYRELLRAMKTAGNSRGACGRAMGAQAPVIHAESVAVMGQ